MITTTITGYAGFVRLVPANAKNKSAVLNINLATNRKVGDREFTDWVSVKVWGDRAAKLAPHISKGSHLLVVGRPEARAYKANDGTPKAELVVHANELEFLSAKAKGETHHDHEDNGIHEEEGELVLT